ncbi:MAG: DUF1905 domain-containing protein [Alphaproteobacteria bacterium]|nr:DUF1905 domain-containing protein [Alphaproteobacteria bacterium]
MIPEQTYDFKSEIWLFQGQGAWYFVTLPADITARIRQLISGPRRGWGAIRVRVTIGDTRWQTSIFPYKALDAFILPLKAKIRKAEGLTAGDRPHIQLTVLE